MGETMLLPLRSLWKRWLCGQIKKILSDNCYKEVNKSARMRLMKLGVSEGEREGCVCAHAPEREGHVRRGSYKEYF